MWRGILLTIVAVPLCFGAACELSCSPLPPGDPPDTELPLDLADCELSIIENLEGTQAEVTARITDSQSRPVEMSGGQSVVVNGEALAGPDAHDEYVAVIPAAERYEVVVTEPTRGVLTTAIDAPPAFEITSPAEGGDASLSGFTLEWSNPAAEFEVRIALRQAILGTSRQTTGGPVADAGSFEFSAADLAVFQQGADLVIIVTKAAELDAINGFDGGTLSVIRPVRATVNPAP